MWILTVRKVTGAVTPVTAIGWQRTVSVTGGRGAKLQRVIGDAGGVKCPSIASQKERNEKWWRWRGRVCLLSQRRNKAPNTNDGCRSRLASFRPFLLLTVPWSHHLPPFPSHAQPILSFPCDHISFKITEALHRTFRRVWSRFQSKFRQGSRHSPPSHSKEGQECRKDSHPHLERRQGQGTRSHPQRRRARHPRWQLFPP